MPFHPRAVPSPPVQVPAAPLVGLLVAFAFTVAPLAPIGRTLAPTASIFAPVLTTLTPTLPELAAQERPRPEDTEIWEPVPEVVTPGQGAGLAAGPPSDAVVLFDGGDLSEWVNVSDRGPAGWEVSDGIVTVNKIVGDIETRRRFLDYRLHVEWRIPENVTGSGQARGNSGVYLGWDAERRGGYELQILDSYGNPTYVNGMAGSIYKQAAPLVNAARPPGAWQSYDIIWTAPRFTDDGELASPARITVFWNGVLVQHEVELRGETRFIGTPEYRPHGPGAIMLQAHGDPSPPISFRSIWLRELR